MPASLLASQFATLEPLRAGRARHRRSTSTRASTRSSSSTSTPSTEGELMSPLSALLPLRGAPTSPQPVAPGWQLILAALAGIALIVVLITVVKLHPFLALIFGALTVGVVAGENVCPTRTGWACSRRSPPASARTAAGVGILIALGAMFAKLLADSGGADQIVDTIVGRASPRALPWAMALVGAIIGLPMFFEIGLVLLMPVIYLVARRAAGLADHRRHPGAGRPLGHARPGAAAPRPADRDRLPARGPRPHAGARRAGRGAHRHRRRPAVRPARRALGRRPGAAHLRRRHASRGGAASARRSASRCSASCCPSG